MESNWYAEIEKLVNTQTTGMNNREIRYFQVGRLLRMARQADRLHEGCEICRKFRDELPELVSKLSSYFEGPPEDRIRYEKVSDDMLKHFRHRHGVYLKRYFTAMYSVLGMVAGIFTGMLGACLYAQYVVTVPDNLYRNGIILGWLAGLVAGQIAGNRKDRMVEKEGRQI